MEKYFKITIPFLLISFFILFLLYKPALNAPYFLTDDALLIEIPQLSIHKISDLKSLFIPGMHVDYYPIRDISYAIDKALAPNSTYFAHMHQLFLFALAGSILLSILISLGIGLKISILAASIWLLHPYHAEMVSWLSARKDILSLLFTLLSANFALLTIKKSNTIFGIFTIIFFLFAGFSKSNLCLIPFAALFYLFANKKDRSTQTIITFLICAALALGILAINNWQYTEVNDMRAYIPYFDRLQMSSSALGKMFLGIFIPYLNIFDLDNFGEWLSLNKNYQFFGLLCWLAFIITTAYQIKKKNSTALLFLLLIFLSYLPISALLFPHSMFYSVRYFEPIFVLFIIAFFINQKHEQPIFIKLATFLLLPILAYATSSEARTWKSSTNVFLKAYQRIPESINIQSNLLAAIINEKNEEYNDLKLELIKNLESKCGNNDANSNCISFLRYKYEISKINKRELDEKNLELLLKNLSVTKPTPKSTQRIIIENELSKPTPDHALITEWLQSAKHFPTEKYRSLQLSALCITNQENEANKLLSYYLENNLIRKITGQTFFGSSKCPTIPQPTK